MTYIDTSILLSYYLDEDPNHSCAVRVVEAVRARNREIVVSPLTITELYSVIARRIHQLRLPPHVKHLDEKIKISVVVKLILNSVKPKIVDDEQKVEPLDSTNIFHIFAKAINLAHKLRHRTLDLIHIAYATNLASKGLVNSIATLDKEIMSRAQELRDLGLEVLEITCSQS